MAPITSGEDAERARQAAYEAERHGNHAKAMELWKILAFYDHTIDHGQPVEAWALEYDESGDSERADRAYRVALLIDPGDQVKISNYAAFLLDAKRLREAWTLFNSIGDQGNYEPQDTAYRLAREIEIEVGSDVLKNWGLEPLDVDAITRATSDDLESFKRELRNA